MSAPEKVEATGVETQMYKCLLYQYSQKFWKQLPVYQTYNEGSGHQPQFRSTVWFDGVSYTSPNTFPQRKMAEMDASRIAFFAALQKLKDEASHLVHEDKSFCKSILVEYAVRMNIEKPIYQTAQLDLQVPVFRSSLVFNNVVYPGDSGRSKKEAEQLAAHAVILKYLDSESWNIISEIIKSKFRNYAEMKGSHNGTTLNEGKVEVPEVSTQAITAAIPVPSVLAPTPFTGTMNTPTSSVIPATHISSNVIQPPISVPPVLAQTPFTETNKSPTSSVISALSLTQFASTPATHISSNVIQPVITVPPGLAQTSFSETNNTPTSSVVSAPCLTQFASNPATHMFSNVIQPANSEAPSVTTPSLPFSLSNLTQLPFVTTTSSKKRNRKNKKNAQKKMRVEAQSPVPPIPLSQAPVSQVPTFVAQ